MAWMGVRSRFVHWLSNSASFGRVRGLLGRAVVILSLVGLLPAPASSQTPGSVSVVINRPAPNSLQGSTLSISARVTSTFQIATVTARVQSVTATLNFSSGLATGVLSLNGLPLGPTVLTVTATDVFGTVGTATQPFVFDRPPVVTLVQPGRDTAVRSTFRLVASCADDDLFTGCVSFTVWLRASGGLLQLAAGTTSIDEVVTVGSLPASALSRPVTLEVWGRDSAGQTSYLTGHTIFVEESPNLTLVETLPGRVLDVDADRILFIEDGPGTPALRIRDRASRQDTLITNDPNKVGDLSAICNEAQGHDGCGLLTPTGVVFGGRPPGGSVLTTRLYEWTPASLVQLSATTLSATSTAGRYLAWYEFLGAPISSNSPPFFRDLLAGTTVTIPFIGEPSRLDVASNGDVVVGRVGGGIYRYRGSAVQQLTASNDHGPATDGSNVVYHRIIKTSDPSISEFRLLSDAGDEVVGEYRSDLGFPSRGDQYQVDGGWVAFTDTAADSTHQVKVRSPGGVVTPLSFFSTSSNLDVLAPTGELTFTNQSRRYLVSATRSAIDVGSGHHSTQSYFVDGVWYVSHGRSLFLVNDGPMDHDGDGLPTLWELQFRLDPTSASGRDGPDGDPDGDGVTNAQELAAGTHPLGLFTRFFAEGATSHFFDTSVALSNPRDTTSTVLLRFVTSDATTTSHLLMLPGHTRTTLDAKTVPGLATAEFSTVIESDVEIVADRTMQWTEADGYGSHADASISASAPVWYLAEGATHSGFNLFYLVQNPNAADVTVEVSYLLPGGGAPLVKTYPVPANSRFNIWVNQEASSFPALASTDVSAILRATDPALPIIVERAMYLDLPGQMFGAGHESAGVTSPSLQWFFAEGATGDFFDLFILLSNPNPTPAAVQADYLLPDGTVVIKTRHVAPNSRDNIWVDLEDPLLANTAVSTTITVTNGVPIIAERAMWWPATMTPGSWVEAHNSPGSSVTGTQWAFAEGEVGGGRDLATYILIANPSSFRGYAEVMLLFDDGTTTTRAFWMGPTSRISVAVPEEFPDAAGRRFGAVITSVARANGTPEPQIVVERSMYSDANGVDWAAGTNALATCVAGCPGLPPLGPNTVTAHISGGGSGHVRGVSESGIEIECSNPSGTPTTCSALVPLREWITFTATPFPGSMVSSLGCPGLVGTTTCSWAVIAGQNNNNFYVSFEPVPSRVGIADVARDVYGRVTGETGVEPDP